MALTNAVLKKLIDDHSGDIAQELQRLERIRRYVEGCHDKPYTPRNATQQYKKLVDRSVTNLLPMVRNAPLQQLHVDGVWADNETGADVAAWDAWQSNNMDQIHVQVISAALTDNYSYVVVTPATRKGKSSAKFRPFSAKRMYALWEDPVSDSFPQYAFELDKSGEIIGIWDEVARYPVTTFPTAVNSTTGQPYTPPPVLGPPAVHGAGVCPVIRFTPNMDLDGNCYGEIESNIPVQDRVNQVSFDLLMVQHYGAFQIRGFSGFKVAKDEHGRPRPITMDPAVTPVLEDPDSKAWALPGSPLEGYIAALEEAIYELAVSSQTPAHYVLGKLANLSADAIAAAETTLTRKVIGYKHTLGESFEQMLRLASKYMGVDFPDTAEIQWADRESRSLAQVADAINKLVNVGVPQEALWEMLPNVTKTQIDDWKKLAAEQQQAQKDSLDAMAEKLVSQNKDPEALPDAQ